MQMTQATLVSKVVAAANDRGARGEERTLVRLRDEAIAEQQEAPVPASVISSLATVVRKDGSELNETSPVQFVYAFYLVRKYGYEPRDARRIAKRFGRELDGMFLSDDTATRIGIASAEADFALAKKDTLIADSIEALRSRSVLLAKRAKDGSLTPADEASIASIVETLRDITTHSVVGLVNA